MQAGTNKIQTACETIFPTSIEPRNRKTDKLKNSSGLHVIAEQGY